MSDFARLKDKLHRLRQRERAPGEARKLRGGDAEARLASIVSEIDETILPRRLTFTLGNGTQIHLAVANRRLQALLGPAPGGIDAELVDVELPDADDPKVAALAEGLRGVLQDAENAKISSMRPASLFPSDIGVPVSQLRKAWGVEVSEDTGSVDPAEVLTRFLGSLGDDAVAWLRIEGENVADQGGDEAEVAALGETAAIFLDSYFSKFETVFPEPSLACGTVISPADGASAALFFLECGELSAVISAKPDKVLSLATRWQGLISE